MPKRTIPLEDLLQVAKKGSLDGIRLPATVATELRKARAEAKKAAALSLLGDVPAEVANGLAAVPEEIAATSEPATLAREAVAAARLDARAAARLTGLLDRAERESRLDPALPETDPAQGLLDQARLAEAVTAAGIGAEGAKAVLARLSGTDDLSDQTIGTLVAEGAIGDAEGLRLGRTIGLARLLDDNAAAAAKLLDTRFSTPVEDLPDLLDLSTDELAKAIGAADPALRKTARQWAEDMQGHLAETFPMRGITARLRQAAPLPAEGDFSVLATALEGRQALWNGEEEPADAATKTALDTARALDRAWPGLGIGARLVKPDDSTARIGREIAAAESFFRRNEEKSLLDLDLSPGSDDLKEIDFTDVPKELRPRIVDAVKARARAYHLAGEVETTARLMSAGVHTMQAAIGAGIEGLIAGAGLDRTRAERVVAAAHDRRADVVATVIGMAEALRWDVDRAKARRPFLPLLPDVTDGLRALPGYEDLFGDQSYCDCDHCGSILSPAAYFVDLMKWVDENITAKVFTGTKANHALKLRERRPDLWTLPLTCENTETLIPTLDVINEVLETALAHAADAALPLTDRAAVLRKVYVDVLPAFIRSFVGPFDLRVARADRLLTSFEVDRLAIADLVRTGAPALELAAAGLAMPLAAAAEIVTERTGWAHLEALFAQGLPRTGDTVTAFDVQDLIAGMGTDRALLGDLAASRFVTDGGAVAVKLASGKRSAASVQNDIERISGLTSAALDRLARLYRLTKVLHWPVTAIDLALDRAGRALTPDVLLTLVRADRIAQRLSLGAEGALAVSGPIPEVSFTEGEPGMMDRLFNLAPGGRPVPRLPDAAVRFVHPSFRAGATLPDTGATAEHFLLQRLRFGLGVDDPTLVALITTLAPSLGFDPAAPNEDDRGFPLDTANLSLLWRHATLGAALSLPPAGLARAAEIATGRPDIDTLAHAAQVIALMDGLKRIGMGVPLLSAAMGLVEAGVFLDADHIAADLVASIGAGEALRFAPTVFAFVPGVSEDQSRAIVAANAALFDALPDDMLRLRPGVGLAPVLTPPPGGLPVAEAALQAELDMRNLRRVLPAELAARLGMEEQALSALAALSGADLGSAPVLSAFGTGPITPLSDAIALLARGHALLEPVREDASALAFLHANRAALGLPPAGLPALTQAQGIALFGYARLIADMAKAATGQNAVAAMAAVLSSHNPATGFAAAPRDDLARITGALPTEVRLLANGVALPANPVLALLHLRAVARLARDHALPADALILTASADPVSLEQGAESLSAALRRKLGDEASFAGLMETHDNALRGLRRDALTDHAIRRSSGRFASQSDLYDYYLIDPSMEGCARTSRLVSAMGSVQTYVHRILLNLEQDRRAANAADHVHVSPTLIPKDEWEWRKNYRVWEANRKVFLWPENYMFEALRDNKTPAFERLEKELLQQEVNEQTVLDAYSRYLADFEAEAGLQIGGAFHEYMPDDQRDVLHVFGATQDDPPAWYYWTVENLHYSRLRQDRRIAYSNRTKLGVAIGAREVSPFIYMNRLHLFWVEITTQPQNEIEDGENKFRGYRHTIGLRVSALRLDGSWSPPQSLSLPSSGDLKPGGVLQDLLTIRDPSEPWAATPKYADSYSLAGAYSEGYTLRAPAWRRFYPGLLAGQLVGSLGARHYPLQLDLFARQAHWQTAPVAAAANTQWRPNRVAFHVVEQASASPVYERSIPATALFALATPRALIDVVKSRASVTRNVIARGTMKPGLESAIAALNVAPATLGAAIAVLADPSARLIVPESNWAMPEMIFQKEGDALFFGHNPEQDRPYQARRIGTTLVRDLTKTLFYGGVSTLLDKRTQKSLREKAHLIASQNGRTELFGTTSGMDFTGPLGTYYREVFLHIPMLIAEHLNAKGEHAAAQGWYAAVFDPTADFDPGVTLTGLTDEQRLQAERDRVWRFAEFQGQTPPTLRAILTDDAAQEAYRRDPFNPFAIARLRLSAFQKNAVMRYVQNLIDWGDTLFRQFTMESVDEAHVLYDMAEQILGPRPADAGPCGEGAVQPRDYAHIAPKIDAGQDFLVEVESWILGKRRKRLPTRKSRVFVRQDADAITRAESRNPKLTTLRMSASPGPMARERSGAELVEAEVSGFSERMLRDDLTTVVEDLSSAPLRAGEAYEVRVTGHAGAEGAAGRQIDWMKNGSLSDNHARAKFGRKGENWKNLTHYRPDRIGFHLVRQISPVFCVPRNKDLLALWDRVEDRLFKIRNCRNIDGERVDLALFAPEIDPMALVRARAAGLSLSEVLNAGSGALPPYRFSYLIARARDYAGQAQGFATRLQGAIERRDGEELSLLRQSQGADMLALVTRARERELALAQTGLAELERRQTAVRYRRGHTEGLVEEDLNAPERAQQVMMHTSTASHAAAALLSGTGGILHLIPQLGSPFAMKYGGQELGSSAKNWSKVFSDTANLLDIAGRSVALEAGFERRRTGWTHQVKLDNHELKQIDRQIAAAKIRVEIAERALLQHTRSIEDCDEILALMQSRFSNLDLFAWLAGELQRLSRQSFNAAMSMARLAQAAYRFERPDDAATLLQPTYWDAGRGGLLAAERLSADLVEMEKRFIEGNFRRPEISQPFSVMQVDPAALLRLKQTGEAEVTLPESAFDLLYPGHYRRRIRSVRLTMACVTGPFVNIPVTLTLTAAKIRMNATLDGPAGLVATPLRHTVQIATSTAQNDGGMFDFSFADARYLPFEGTGAVESTWRIALPRTFRPFNYDTISDVVLHIAYQAESDGVLRDRVETDDPSVTGTLAKALKDHPLPRLLGLRQEFATVFHQLTTLPLGVETDLVLDSRVLPLPLRGRPVTLTRALLLVKPKAGLTLDAFTVTLNGQALSGFTALPEFPNYMAKPCDAALGADPVGTHRIAVTDAGGLAAVGGPAPFAEGAVEDMVLYLEARL